MKQGIFFIGKRDVLDMLKKEPPEKKVEDFIKEVRGDVLQKTNKEVDYKR